LHWERSKTSTTPPGRARKAAKFLDFHDFMRRVAPLIKYISCLS